MAVCVLIFHADFEQVPDRMHGNPVVLPFVLILSALTIAVGYWVVAGGLAALGGALIFLAYAFRRRATSDDA